MTISFISFYDALLTWRGFPHFKGIQILIDSDLTGADIKFFHSEKRMLEQVRFFH